ncbi:1-aminocyclopropane-1-carboxylate deaminase/D-cysteine desulfhydrase [Arcobacter sp. FWKO B]|uniref:1-aminocyclopropane-1-carboxylate deaminase/D-cysteine desulfhydrase n=1 Tax=Arcobacter sp. FWKO B TaxID=2593672 RepID=UPI0018A523F4|nr:1-aminocyclopropane-1-carboxylate deaminase/D-cysteine desulfhydrase [Arcobacter sp. FWKO B]QOG11960.1 1-aminocyclopropane-1-carboxylate deaminase/D-cysteine desulfhydrase [Arcobacter sp. FWKO B]
MNSIKLNTPIQKITFRDLDIFLKRDDLINEDFSGNKARKFYYYLANEFPHIKKLVSYGSNQSNAMYSMSVLSRLKGWEFEYYCDHISSYLLENPSGNYKASLANGAKIINLNGTSRPELKTTNEVLYIPEGGYAQESKYGIKILAEEINSWISTQKNKDFKIFLPSGTGTTALFLQEYLMYPVYTCACVGDSAYLKKEFFGLNQDETKHPIILETSKKYHFGNLYKNLYELWVELKAKTMIEFDLLYDPVGFDTLLLNLNEFENSQIIYIHQGGLIGNITMKQRYERKYTK